MSVPAAIRGFWAEFMAAAGADVSARFYEVFHFEDNAASADELADLVVLGVKRATAPLLWSLEADGKPLPTPGTLSVVTNWAGDPLCIIETQKVDIVPFNQVDAEFAAIEGEGDGSLAYWREAHSAYYARECARIGRNPCDSMPVICEQFKVVFRAEGLAFTLPVGVP